MEMAPLIEDIGLKLLPFFWQKAKERIRAVWVRFRLPQIQKRVPADDDLSRSAFSVLGGSVERVMAYRDLPGGRLRMLACRKPFDQSYELQFFLLEQFGPSFRVVWSNPQNWCVSNSTKVRVADMDRDGVHEIYVVTASYGTGGGSEDLHCFVPVRNASYTVSWQLDWQSWDSAPVRRITADFEDPAILRIMEQVAAEFGLCRPDPEIDLSDPKNAVLRWRKENGDMTNGRVKAHHYPGVPNYFRETVGPVTPADGFKGAVPRWTETCRVAVQDWLFVGQFKGAVLAFDCAAFEHFVVWSPPSMYEWPTALLYDDNKLYIASRGQGLLRYNLQSSVLVQCKKFGQLDIAKVESIRLRLSENPVIEVSIPGQIATIPVSHFDELEKYLVRISRVGVP